MANGAWAASSSGREVAARQASVATVSHSRKRRSLRLINVDLMLASMSLLTAGWSSLNRSNATDTSQAGQMAHAAATGVDAPARPR
eukprot:scaffold23365_cov115-Isochrysis_galbana.AAC.8